MTLSPDFRRLLVAAVLSVALLALRFVGLSLGPALWLQNYLGYWSVLLALAWFTWCLWRAARRSRLRPATVWREHRLGLMLILAGAVFLHLHEPHRLKVLNDEPAHVAGSLLLHKERLASTPARAHWFNEEPHLMEARPMMRLYLFSVLLSMVHDVSGYRVENVFVLNGLLATAVLALLYAGGCAFSGPWAGRLAVVLFAGFPLFAQVTTSGSYDVLNLAMLLALLLATRHYWRSPGTEGLELMLATGVLLALCRYESLLYLGLPIGAVLLKARREGRLTFTWPAAASPLLVWPSFVSNYIMLSGKVPLSRHLADGQNFFGWEHLPGNLKSAVYYLFHFDLGATNSLLLSGLGVVGLLGLWVAAVARRGLPAGPRGDLRLLATMAALVTLMYAFVLTNFWGMPTHGAATRFILPFGSLLALAAAWAAGDLVRSATGRRWILGAATLWALTFTVSSNARAATTARMVFPQSYAWLLDYAREHDRGRTLYVAPSPLYMFCYGYPSIPTTIYNRNTEKLRLCLEARLYDEIIVHELRWLDPFTGEWTTGVAEPAIAGSYEVIAERRFAHDQVSRLLRFVPPAEPLIDPDSGKPEKRRPLRTRFESKEEQLQYLFRLLP